MDGIGKSCIWQDDGRYQQKQEKGTRVDRVDEREIGWLLLSDGLVGPRENIGRQSLQ